MAIEPFKNHDYELILSDLIADIYYSNISVGSRIILLRKLTELLARKFLNLGAGEYMNLGDITTDKKNPKFKVTEQCNKVDNRLIEDFKRTINSLRELGNKYTHTADISIANIDEFKNAEDSIWDLFSYLFVQYFLKYSLSLKSDKNVLSFFSVLPPEIRYRTLKKLIEIKKFDNIQLINKFLLSIVKARGFDEARCWLYDNRKTIKDIPYPSEADIIEYEEDFCQNDLPLKLREHSNCYSLLETVLNHTIVQLSSHGVYRDFEEAVYQYKKYNLDLYLSSSEEQEIFKDLIKFCFIGRVPAC
ncbi:TPA: hypothetical protein U5Y80_001044 [Streptococcus agalactiae]|nr:hypothetical protein [Streptococcus agalactiae]